MRHASRVAVWLNLVAPGATATIEYKPASIEIDPPGTQEMVTAMQFADVIGSLFEGEDGYRLVVMLDKRSSAATVRDERIPQLLRKDGVPDRLWTVDQLTQETIGTDLAEEGWEAVAQREPGPRTPGDPVTVHYLVRKV